MEKPWVQAHLPCPNSRKHPPSTLKGECANPATVFTAMVAESVMGTSKNASE